MTGPFSYKHNLKLETGRYTRHKTEICQRISTYCDSHEIEMKHIFYANVHTLQMKEIYYIEPAPKLSKI